MPIPDAVYCSGPPLVVRALAMNLAVVLPTYNEAPNLEKMVTALLGLNLSLRIIIVDDASPDGTGEIADRLATAFSNVSVLHRVNERGLGTAYLAGFRRALADGADAVISMDCDFSHDPGALPELAAAGEAADVVIGSRYVSGGSIRNWPAHRRWISWLANRFVQSLFRLPAHDCTSGYRLYRAGVLRAVPFERIRSTGYSFLVETLFWATALSGVRLRETPIAFTERREGKSKLGWKEAASGARHLLSLRMRLSQESRVPLPAIEPRD